MNIIELDDIHKTVLKLDDIKAFKKVDMEINIGTYYHMDMYLQRWTFQVSYKTSKGKRNDDYARIKKAISAL